MRHISIFILEIVYIIDDLSLPPAFFVQVVTVVQHSKRKNMGIFMNRFIFLSTVKHIEQCTGGFLTDKNWDIFIIYIVRQI